MKGFCLGLCRVVLHEAAIRGAHGGIPMVGCRERQSCREAGLEVEKGNGGVPESLD